MLLLLLLLLRGSSTSSVFPALFRPRRSSIAPSQSGSWWQEIFPQIPTSASFSDFSFFPATFPLLAD
jgi:hypothetical protein